MPLKFFYVHATDPEPGSEEVNRFLASKRVLRVDRQFVNDGSSSFWSICVDYLSVSSLENSDSKLQKRGRVDYRELLSPEQFAMFVKLRDLRTQIAQSEAVPVYTVFTNEQLAAMITATVSNREQMAKISGIGDARIEKYADRFLQLMASAHEASN